MSLEFLVVPVRTAVIHRNTFLYPEGRVLRDPHLVTVHSILAIPNQKQVLTSHKPI